MPRQASSAVLAWLAQPGVLPIALFFKGTFKDGTVYLWTGYGDITWNGQTWKGIGTMGGITPIEEGVTVEARGMTVTLSGFDPALLAEVLGQFQLMAPMAVYVAGFNSGVLIADPVAAFVGRMDQPSVDVGEKATIRINCEPVILDMNVAVDRRYTSDDQQRDHPGDLGFSFVPEMQEFTLWWGQAPVSGANI